MKLRIRDTTRRDGVRAYAEHRMRFALGRFSDRVGLVAVWIGQHGKAPVGTEFSCRIQAQLAPFGIVTVKETGVDTFAAIDRAAGRIERLVAHRTACR